MIKFGVAGNSRSFYEEGKESTVLAAPWCREKGIDVFEYSFGRGIKLSDKTASELKTAFTENGVEMTVHAPYYINFANPDPEMIDKSVAYVTLSLKKAHQLGGNRVVVHPATQGKVSRKEALDASHRNLEKLAERIADSVLPDSKICLETMGKIAQIGDEKEIADFCGIAPFFYPCVDFGHLNARTLGSLKTADDYERVITNLSERLPEEKVKHMHVHFSKIMYGDKGEIKHLTFADEEYGPRFEPLCEVLLKYGLEPYIICESDGTQAEDAVSMKCYYLNSLNK